MEKIITALFMLVCLLSVLLASMVLHIKNLQVDIKACLAESIAIDETKNGILLPPKL